MEPLQVKYWVTPPGYSETIYSRDTLEEAREAAIDECLIAETPDPIAVIYQQGDGDTISPVTAFTCEGLSETVKEVKVESYMILGTTLKAFYFVD